jgi:hypothetical protein
VTSLRVSPSTAPSLESLSSRLIQLLYGVRNEMHANQPFDSNLLLACQSKAAGSERRLSHVCPKANKDAIFLFAVSRHVRCEDVIR